MADKTATETLASLKAFLEEPLELMKRGGPFRATAILVSQWDQMEPLLERLRLDEIEDEAIIPVLIRFEALAVKFRDTPFGYIFTLLVDQHRTKYGAKVELPMPPV